MSDSPPRAARRGVPSPASRAAVGGPDAARPAGDLPADALPSDAPKIDALPAEHRPPPRAFAPVPVRYRYDGWVPDRQLLFIERLAECGCVEQAARSVGMSRNAAYALRRRGDAQAFRLAWDAAMDTAVARLADAALARAIHGVPVPIFRGGEQVGERRHFDERLTMFLLRYRDPMRYGKWLDEMDASQHQDGPVTILAYRTGRMLRAAWAAFDAALRGAPAPAPQREHVDKGNPPPWGGGVDCEEIDAQWNSPDTEWDSSDPEWA